MSPNIAYQDAIARVDEQIANARNGVERYALTLDTTTEAGRQNLGSFQLEEILVGREQAVELALQIRGDNDRGLSPDPVGIGGELYATRIENGYVQTALWHRFPDYEDMLNAMKRRLYEHNASAETGVYEKQEEA